MLDIYSYLDYEATVVVDEVGVVGVRDDLECFVETVGIADGEVVLVVAVVGLKEVLVVSAQESAVPVISQVVVVGGEKVGKQGIAVAVEVASLGPS